MDPKLFRMNVSTGERLGVCCAQTGCYHRVRASLAGNGLAGVTCANSQHGSGVDVSGAPPAPLLPAHRSSLPSQHPPQAPLPTTSTLTARTGASPPTTGALLCKPAAAPKYVPLPPCQPNTVGLLSILLQGGDGKGRLPVVAAPPDAHGPVLPCLPHRPHPGLLPHLGGEGGPDLSRGYNGNLQMISSYECLHQTCVKPALSAHSKGRAHSDCFSCGNPSGASRGVHRRLPRLLCHGPAPPSPLPADPRRLHQRHPGPVPPLHPALATREHVWLWAAVLRKYMGSTEKRAALRANGKLCGARMLGRCSLYALSHASRPCFPSSTTTGAGVSRHLGF